MKRSSLDHSRTRMHTRGSERSLIHTVATVTSSPAVGNASRPTWQGSVTLRPVWVMIMAPRVMLMTGHGVGAGDCDSGPGIWMVIPNLMAMVTMRNWTWFGQIAHFVSATQHRRQLALPCAVAQRPAASARASQRQPRGGGGKKQIPRLRFHPEKNHFPSNTERSQIQKPQNVPK